MGKAKINPMMARHLGNSETQISGIITGGIMGSLGITPTGKKKDKYVPFNENKIDQMRKKKL